MPAKTKASFMKQEKSLEPVPSNHAEERSVTVPDEVGRSDYQGRKAGGPVLHALSGALILGLDNLLFGANVSTGGIGTAALCGIGFAASFAGVFLIQKCV